jgi:hypothetical protein
MGLTREQIEKIRNPLVRATLLKKLNPKRATANDLLGVKNESQKAKKPRRKRNSNPDMAKADELFSMRYRGKPCEPCASMGKINTFRTTNHHFIPRSLSRFLRYEPRNQVVVCQGHHKFGGSLCFHGVGSIQVAAAKEWMEKNRSEDYAYCMEHQHTKCTESWKQSLEKLSGSPSV